MRAGRKGRKEREVNPIYITTAGPQSVSTRCYSGFKDDGKLQAWKLSPEAILKRSVLLCCPRCSASSHLQFCWLGFFAVLANVRMMSNLMFPKFLQKCRKTFVGPIVNYLGKEKFADTRNKNCVGLGYGF